MAAAKPLLASMDGEGRAAVEQAGCGWASAACDVDALAQNMQAACSAGMAERAALGERAFAYYRAHYRRRELLTGWRNHSGVSSAGGSFLQPDISRY